jgi:hypothetical protein
VIECSGTYKSFLSVAEAIFDTWAIPTSADRRTGNEDRRRFRAIVEAGEMPGVALDSASMAAEKSSMG